MTREEVSTILSKTLMKRKERLDSPTKQDWEVLTQKFHCNFNQDFIWFMEEAGLYELPGEIYDVNRNGKTSGNGTIASIYDSEMNYSGEPLWNASLIPFYGIGNGDCFCLSACRGEYSPVFYVYHEDGHAEEEYPTFEAFLLGLPELLKD